MAIHAVSTTDVKGKHSHLFDLQSYLKNNPNMSIEELIQLICERDTEVQKGRKAAHLDAKELSKVFHDLTSGRKADYMDHKTTRYLNIAAVLTHIAAAKFGAPATALATALSQTTSVLGQNNQSQIERHGHTYQSTADHIGAHTQGTRAADEAHAQVHALLNRIIEQQHRVAQTICSA